MPNSFIDLGVPANLATRLAELEILEPYPIQHAALPDALAGLDICAQSPTGSGKTLAFALPIAARVSRAQSKRPRALILAPTRELAAQITEEIRPLAEVAGRRVAAFYGGTGFKDQLSNLARGTDIAVGCPGRLIDLLERRALFLNEVEIVVVDEADRMADMGFLPPVRQLLDEIRGAHQTMLFSATLAGDVERLIRDYQHTPKRHVLNAPADHMGTRTHEFWRATREDRAALTANLAAPYGSTIVFCRTKRGVDRLTKQLCQAGLYAVPIHGDRSQAQRDRALAQFRERSAQVLVGTDVAARGIHVDDVDCVIHFDPPEDEDTYIHRSGRTGRAGGAGRVVSLISREQEGPSQKMQRNLKIASSFIDPPRPGPLPKLAMRAAPPMPQPNGNANGGKGGPGPAYAGGRHSSSSNQGASTSYSAARSRNRRSGPAASRPAVSAGASQQRSGDWQRSGDAPRSATPRRRPR